MTGTTKVLFFKKETVYGTDATPTGAANAVLTRNFTAKPIVTDRIQRSLDKPVRGRTADAPSNLRGTFSYELELAGSGVAGTAPAWMEHLEACGMAAPVLTTTTSAVQAFAALGAALSSATANHWHGNQKRVNLGSRGTFSFDFTAGAYPFVKLDMTGLIPAANDITDAVPGQPDFSRWHDPLEVNTANTDFLLGGYAAVLKSLTGDVNAAITARNLVGSNAINRGNHGITGKIVCDAPLIASKNYFANLKAGDEIPMQLVHGTQPGAIVQLDAAHLQITDIDLVEDADADILQLSIGYGLNVGTTPDDLIITAK